MINVCIGITASVVQRQNYDKQQKEKVRRFCFLIYLYEASRVHVLVGNCCANNDCKYSSMKIVVVMMRNNRTLITLSLQAGTASATTHDDVVEMDDAYYGAGGMRAHYIDEAYGYDRRRKGKR